MNVVCNNPVLYVVDYPAQHAIEVIDKRNGRGVLMRDATAERFRRELREIVPSEDTADFDELIEHYSALLTQPMVYH